VPGENGQFSSAFWVKTKSALTYIEYLNYLERNYKIKLKRLGISAQTVSNISEYARDKYDTREYDEVYAEYIVKYILTRK
jgi:hypothetical protein